MMDLFSRQPFRMQRETDDGNERQEVFERCMGFFNRALAGNIDEDELAALYASEFIAALAPTAGATCENKSGYRLRSPRVVMRG